MNQIYSSTQKYFINLLKWKTTLKHISHFDLDMKRTKGKKEIISSNCIVLLSIHKTEEWKLLSFRLLMISVWHKLYIYSKFYCFDPHTQIFIYSSHPKLYIKNIIPKPTGYKLFHVCNVHFSFVYAENQQNYKSRMFWSIQSPNTKKKDPKWWKTI